MKAGGGGGGGGGNAEGAAGRAVMASMAYAFISAKHIVCRHFLFSGDGFPIELLQPAAGAKGGER